MAKTVGRSTGKTSLEWETPYLSPNPEPAVRLRSIRLGL